MLTRRLMLGMLALGFAGRDDGPLDLEESRAISALRKLSRGSVLCEPPRDGHAVQVDLREQGIDDADLDHWIPPLRSLRKLELAMNDITDAGLASLEGLKSLRELDLSATEIKGSGLNHLRGLGELRSLGLASTNIKEGGLGHVRRLVQVRRLGLGDNHLTDEDLKPLAGMPLEELSLTANPITDQGLTTLLLLPTLRVVRLCGCEQLTEKGFETLRGIKGLLCLDVSGSPIGFPELRAITEITGLEEIDLSHTEVGDEALVLLKKLSRLRALDLMGCDITDEGLNHLKGLVSLRTLDLSSTLITEKGLPQLSALINLKELRISGNKVSEACVAKLRARLPSAHISIGDEASPNE